MTSEQTANTVPSGVKTTYLRDDYNEDRVLTVVRVFDPHTFSVKFGWSINCPTEWKRQDSTTLVADESGKQKRVGVVTYTEKKGDQFCRKTGRTLALQKMESDPHIAYLSHSKETPLKAVLKYIIAEGDRLELPFHVIAIAKQHVVDVRDYTPPPAPLKKNLLDRVMDFFRGE